MIEINLLPQEFRKKPISLSFGKSGLYAIATVIGVLVMLAGITIYQMRQLSTLETNIRKARQRAAMLEKDIKLVDALIDVKQKIHRRMAAVEQLDSHRSAWVRILEDVVRNVPEFVWLSHFKEEPLEDTDSLSNKQSTKQTQPGGQQAKQQQSQPGETSASTNPWVRWVEVEGYAFTLNALASFMINMMRSDYFDNVELVSTDEVTFQEQKAYNFVLSCDLYYLSDEELRGLIAQANDQGGSRQSTTSHKGLN